jgi:hypothetical protein
MKRKEYESPTTQVVQLKQQPQLLVGSNGQAGVQNYENWHNVDEE